MLLLLLVFTEGSETHGCRGSLVFFLHFATSGAANCEDLPVLLLLVQCVSMVSCWDHPPGLPSIPLWTQANITMSRVFTSLAEALLANHRHGGSKTGCDLMDSRMCGYLVDGECGSRNGRWCYGEWCTKIPHPSIEQWFNWPLFMFDSPLQHNDMDLMLLVGKRYPQRDQPYVCKHV